MTSLSFEKLHSEQPNSLMENIANPTTFLTMLLSSWGIRYPFVNNSSRHIHTSPSRYGRKKKFYDMKVCLNDYGYDKIKLSVSRN